jgi:DNA modification methylase
MVTEKYIRFIHQRAIKFKRATSLNIDLDDLFKNMLVSVLTKAIPKYRSDKGPLTPHIEWLLKGLIRVDKKVKGKRKSDSIGIQGSRLKHDYVQTFTNYPKDILEFESESGLHPTQKPVPLLKYLIRTYTRKGETVLDNTMGSGSTGVAAIETRRNFIGIEKKPEFFKIACKRIKKAKR